MAYSNEYAISKYRKYRVYLTASVTSNTNTTSTVSYTAQFQMTQAYHYGCKLSVSGGKTVTGVLGSNPGSSWATVCTASGTINVSRGTSAKTYRVTASGSGATVNGYSPVPGSVSVSVDVTIPALPTYTVAYNANNGSGAPASQTKTYGQTLKLSTVKPTRAGYNFLGWATSSTATTATYQPGGSYTTNAGTTLYAVWQVATLIDLTYKNNSYTVLSGSDGKVTIDTLSSLSLSFDTVYITENKNTNFYVRISNSDRDNPTIFGPYTATNNPTLSLPLPKIMILSALKTMSSNTEFKLNCDVCTGSNSFSNDITSSKIISVVLNNFKFLSQVTSKIVGYRNSNGTAHCELAIQYSPSYSSASSNIVPEYVKVNGTTIPISSIVRTKSMSDSKEFTYKFDLTTSQLATNTSGIIAVCFTDNITTTIVRIKVNSVGNEKIYINETYNSKSDVCRCSEFIEVDAGSKIGFQKGGKVIAHEFIETEAGIQIGDTMYFGELVEI